MILGLSPLALAIVVGVVALLIYAGIRADTFWEDFGISGALAILMTVGVLAILFGLGVWKERVDDATKLAGPLLLVLREVIAAYFQKRREDAQMQHEKDMAEVQPPPAESSEG